MIPGTAGARDVLITIDGRHERLGAASFVGTVRDRHDGGGINVGLLTRVRYGTGPFIEIQVPPGSSGEVLVSETDFAVIEPKGSLRNTVAFYPGIDPIADARAVPLLDVFPDLIPLSEAGRHVVADVASSEGQIHLLLSGENGLWLYAAPDPSVIPEPTAATLALLAAIGLIARRRR